MPLLLAENPRTAAQATIRRATFAAHNSVEQLDVAALADLDRIYRAAAKDIAASIRAYAGADGNLMLAEMRSVLSQIEGRLQALSQARDSLLDGALIRAADLGVRPWTPAGAGAAAVLDLPGGMRVSHQAVNFVRTFVAADGLQLSDRLWRMDRGARDTIVNTIEQAVIQGHSAEQAARELLLRGVGVPADLQEKLRAAQSAGLSRAAQERILADDESGALYNAKRLMRTEINRAHGEAYMLSGEKHPDFGAWRYRLSPAHPAPDICDLLSTQNLHGLGPGCYPNRAQTPWPAHPNTLSFMEIKFQNEITEADRKGKETAIEALNRLTTEQQKGVLGMHKWQTLKDGKLTQGMIRAPWRVVKIRAGDRRVVAPLPRRVIPDVTKAQTPSEARAAIEGRFATKVEMPRITEKQLRSIAAGMEAVMGPHGIKVDTLTWAKARKRYLAAYIHNRFGHQPGLNDEMVFQRTYVARAAAVEAKAEAAIKLKRTLDTARLQELIAMERSEPSRLSLETQLAAVRATTRWAASGDAKDPLFVVAAHESGHALYYTKYQIQQVWLEKLQEFRVNTIEVLTVSKYAQTNPSELFAEVTALIADGRRREVPERILQAYDAAVAMVKR